jgi:hypothetical protein
MSTFQNTLNYTDYHDVDEDNVTIALHGGTWLSVNNAGIVRRHMDYNPIASIPNVASLKNKNSLSQ